MDCRSWRWLKQMAASELLDTRRVAALRCTGKQGGIAPVSTNHTAASDAAILARVIEPDRPNLAPQAARALLALDFNPADKARMRQLSAKAREGTLTPDEEAEIDNYERVGHLLNILQSKARRSLKGRRPANGKAKTR
jgi:hypothetical protein